MINKRRLEEDKNLIMWLNKYFVVNDFTLKLIELFDENKTKKEISLLLNISRFKIGRYYKKIENEIIKRDFYKDNINLKAPIKVQWKVTKKCNLKCRHCYLGELNNFEPSKELVDKILSEILNSNVMEVTLSGGECLTCKYIDYIANTLLSHDIKITIFTNGLLLNRFIEKIDTKYKDRVVINVSVDGLKNTHEQIRGENTFDKTISNIEFAASKGFSITSATVVNSINYDDIIDMIVLLKTKGVKHIQLSNIIIKGRAEKKLELSIEKQMAMKQRLLDLYKEHPEYEHIFYSEVPDEDGKRKVFKIEYGNSEFVGNDNWTCTAGLARLTINEDGRVYCCPFLEKSYLGDLNSNTLEEIWNTKERYEFLDFIIKSNTDRVCVAIKQNKEKD